METDYYFWRELLDTYQSLPDWLKLLWLIVPPVFFTTICALVARVLHLRTLTAAATEVARTAISPTGSSLGYSAPIYRGIVDADGLVCLYPAEPMEEAQWPRLRRDGNGVF